MVKDASPFAVAKIMVFVHLLMVLVSARLVIGAYAAKTLAPRPTMGTTVLISVIVTIILLATTKRENANVNLDLTGSNAIGNAMGKHLD